MLYAFYIYIVFDFRYVVFVQYVNLYAFGTKTPDELVAVLVMCFATSPQEGDSSIMMGESLGPTGGCRIVRLSKY